MLIPKGLRKANDYRDAADKAIKSGAKSLVNTYLDKYGEAAAQGKYEAEVSVPKLYATQVIKILKDKKMAVVMMPSNNNVIVKAYWGPTRKKELGVNLTQSEWYQSQLSQGYKKR